MADLDDLFGRALGEFVLRERLDEGGFATVYRAEQSFLGRPSRAVVVKVLSRRARRNDVSVQRFAREALVSSQLDHPYAAHVYAFGVENDGLVWIAMEFVQGVTLSRLLADQGRMPLERFVPFFQRLAEVVQVAHERGIIHRDLKPLNVMVIERAGQTLPKLLDFGVAKLLDGVTLPHLAATEELLLTDETPRELAAAGGADGVATVRLRLSPARGKRSGHRLTRASAAIGSPPYMAPEQWDGASEVTPAMDLYALGVLAYEALAGRKPFVADTAAEYAALHRHADVPPLGDGLEALDGTFRRALAKNPEDRFKSPLDLAAALRSELEARMVAQIRTAAQHWKDRGRPSGLLWRDEALAELETWIKHTGAGALSQLEIEFVDASRNHEAALQESAQRRARWRRRGAIVAAIAALALVGAFLQNRAALQTRVAEQRARLTQQFAEASVRQAAAEQGRAALLHGEVLDAQNHLAKAFHLGDHSTATEFMLARALQPLSAERARLRAGSGRMWSATFSPDGRRIVTTDDSHARIWDAATNAPIATLQHSGSVYQALYGPDGRRLYTASADGTVRVWDERGALLRSLTARREDGKPARYLYLALLQGGRAIAAIDWMGDRAQVWNTEDGTVIATLRTTGAGFPSIAVSADDKWLAIGGGEDVAIYSTSSWKPTATLRKSRIRTLAFDPRRARIATGSASGDVSIWDAKTGTRVHHLRELGEPVDRVAFSPDGALLAIASRDGSEQIWRPETNTVQSTGVRLQGSTIALEFDPTSRLVLAAGGVGSVVVTDVTLGMSVATLNGPKGAIYSAHFDPTSNRIVAASWDGTARVWDARPPYRSWATPPVSEDCGLFGGVDPDRRFVAIGCRDLRTRVWDTSRNELLAALPAVTRVDGDYSSAYPAVSADGTRAAIARGATVELYELPGDHLLRTVMHDAAVNAVAFAPAGHSLVSGDIGGGLVVTREGREPVVLPREAAGLDAVGFLPDGRVIAADALRRLRVYSSGGARLAELLLDSRARALRISDDGKRLATVPRSATTPAPPELWDLERYQLVGKLVGDVGAVYAARFHSEVLLTAGADNSVHMWDIATGQLMHTYRSGSRTTTDAVIDPRGEFVVAGGGDGSIRFWDRSSEQLLWQQIAHRTPIAALHFEGSDLITRGFGGDISRWTLPLPRAVIDEYEARRRAAPEP